MMNRKSNILTGRERLRKLRGYTLPEVMVAVLIFAMVFIGFYVNLTQGFAAMESARENLRATQILMQQMETIRLYTWSQINSNGFVPTSFTTAYNPTGASSNGLVFNGTITISSNNIMSEPYKTNFVYVTVALTWVSDINTSLTNTRSMSTYVSQYGLHNYYY